MINEIQKIQNEREIERTEFLRQTEKLKHNLNLLAQKITEKTEDNNALLDKLSDYEEASENKDIKLKGLKELKEEKHKLFL